MMYGNYYGYGYERMSPLGFFGGVLEFVFWILIIVLVIKLVRRIFFKGKHFGGMCHHSMLGMHGGRAIETLKERYAKGEIDKKEFEEKKKDLEA